MKRILTLTGFIISLLVYKNTEAQFRVVGYLNTWDNFPNNLDKVDFSKITYLNIAFANPDVSGNLTVFGGLSVVVNKAHANNVKVLMSLGGADLGGTKKNWKDLCDSSNVKKFCNKILNYLQSNDLDGVDIDLEGNIIGNNYGNFIKTLSGKIKPENKLLTAAVATWFANHIPVSSFTYFDFVNIMSYDATGPWDPGNPGPHAPYSMAVDDINFWSKKGLPQDKMGLGLPFYGWGFYNAVSQDEYAYNDIVKQYHGAQNKNKAGDTIYYNGIPLIKKKTALAMQKASGVMIWQVTEDAKSDKSLLNAIHETITAKNYFINKSFPSPESDISVYPNPTQGVIKFIFKGDNTKTITIQLFDSFGKSVLPRQQRKAGDNELNIAAIPAGIYLLVIRKGNESISQKIVKL